MAKEVASTMDRSVLRIALVGTLIAAIGGCASSNTPVQPAAPFSGSATAATVFRRPDRPMAFAPRALASNAAKTSWLAPHAAQQNLLYVSDFTANAVDVYTYPKAALVGTLTGFYGPEGACTDANGNVWIASQDQFTIYEFAHGGTAPIQTLKQQNQLLVGCSVDPVDGTLAVDSFCEINSAFDCIDDGRVFVYADTKKAPKAYLISGMQFVYFCGYDTKGNLFVDGNQTSIGPFVLAELAKGSNAFKTISVDRTIYYPGGVQWDGTHLAVGDQEAGRELASSVHQLAISGSSAKVVSTTKLQGAMDVVQFWIQGSRIVAPDIQKGDDGDVRLFTYPAGGSPLHVIAGLSQPVGAAVSLAPTRNPSLQRRAVP